MPGPSELEINSYMRGYIDEPGERRQNTAPIPLNRVNEEQMQPIRILREKLADSYYHIKRVVVQGKAGTGKSAVFKRCANLCSLASLNMIYSGFLHQRVRHP